MGPTVRRLPGALVPLQRGRLRGDTDLRAARTRPGPLSLLDVVGRHGILLLPSFRTSDKTSRRAPVGELGPLSFQPVEIAKILLVFFFASYFAANRELFSTPTQRIGRLQIVPPKTLLPILFAWGFSMAILGAENDIGFAMLLFALFMSMLWVTTGLKSYVVLGIGLFAGGMYVAARYFSQVHARISVWLNPWVDCVNAGVHNCQIAWGWYSLADGGITGTGLGLGPLDGKIPDLTSDMIASAIGQELGFLGIILIVCLFATFVGEGFHIAQHATLITYASPPPASRR